MSGAFLGTSEFAATVLRRLAGSEAKPSLVVTLPDRRQGRGRKLSPSPVALEAEELGIALLKSGDVNAEEDRERIVGSAGPGGWSAICAFGQLIKEPLLSEAPMLNVHPSLLPRWRGAAPIERAIMAGDEQTGVCIMRLVAGLDSGPVALSETVEVDPDEDFGDLSGRLARIGGDLLVEALSSAASGGLQWTEQDDELATYAEKVESGERRIDPSRTARECHDLVRALTPHVGAWLGLEGDERLGVVRTAPAPGVTVGPGELTSSEGRLYLGCSDQGLELLEVRPPGKSTMDARSFLSGYGTPVPASD